MTSIGRAHRSAHRMAVAACVVVLVSGQGASVFGQAAPAPASPPAAPAAAPAPASAPISAPSAPQVPLLTVPEITTGAVPSPDSPPAGGSILGQPAPGAGPSLPQVPAISLPAPAPPQLTPVQQARLLSPGFTVARDYQRLVQCYGTANFMEAVTRVRASRAGADPNVRAMMGQLINVQGAMQPMVLVASEARTERRFRADYTAVGNRLQAQLRASTNAEATLQSNLRAVQGCERDINRWRGAR